MSDDSAPTATSLVTVGIGATLAALAFAGIVGLVAVVDADHVAAAFGTGLGTAVVVFVLGATIACALACMTRGVAEYPALGILVASGLALDLSAFAIWRSVESTAYGRTLGVFLVISFYGLVVLALRLAVGRPRELAYALYLGTLGMSGAAAVMSAWLIVTIGGSSDATGAAAPVGAADPTVVTSTSSLDAFGFAAPGDSGLFRILGGAFVLIAVLWFAALAASRVARTPADVTR